MGKPLPLETRRAIVRMVQLANCSQEDIARIFKIERQSVQRYWSLFCQTGVLWTAIGELLDAFSAHDAQTISLTLATYMRQPNLNLL